MSRFSDNISLLQKFISCMYFIQEEVRPKRRVPSIKYAIGLIMKHKIHGYMCVITGWDTYCTATTEWMNEMNVGGLVDGPGQPFYNIFVDDGSCHYVAQGNMLLIIHL